MKSIGLLLLTWGFIFGLLETRYFGENWFPQTKEEFICDLTSLIMIITGTTILHVSKRWY